MDGLKAKIDELLSKKELSVYQTAKELGIKEYDVLKFKDKNEFKLVSGNNLLEIIKDLSSWGEVMFIKNTPEFIIEIKLKVEIPKQARGFYNFSGKSGFLGGHLKEDVVKNIGFVSTEFMGILGHSLHFYDKDFDPIFKIFVGRDEKMKLIEDQKERFLNLKNRL